MTEQQPPPVNLDDFRSKSVADRPPEHLDDLRPSARALLRGAIDLHAHAGPDPFAERKMDARELIVAARDAEMAAIVIKSHEYPTQPLAWALETERAMPGASPLEVYGAISLDHGVGGLNPDALEVALRLGTRVVWMPTFDSAWSRDTFGRFNSRAAPITVLDEVGALLPVVHELLDLLEDHGALLCTGHLGPDETLVLVDASRMRGIRTLVTHATAFGIPLEVQQRATSIGALIEQCGNVLFREEGADEATEAILADVRAIGAEHVVLSTDLGQIANPPPPVGFGLWIERFLDAGFTEAELAQMVRDNPRAALG